MNRVIEVVAPQKISVVNRPMPVPRSDEALLKVLYGGLCGSDLSIFEGHFAYGSYPRIPGHEFSAEIISIGENSRGLSPGMIVYANPYFNCGSCYSCKRELFNCCEKNETMGVQRDGAFSQYIVIPIKRLFPAHDLDPKLVSIIEPFCIGYHAIKRAAVSENKRVLVIGAGSIGVLAALAAQYWKAEVYICDLSSNKINYIKQEFNFNEAIIFTSTETLVREVNGRTNGDGFDIVIEAAGNPTAFDAAVKTVAFGGTVVLIGVSNKSLDFEFNVIQKKELNIYGSRNAIDEDFIESHKIISDYPNKFLPLITNIYDFTEVQEAFQNYAKNDGHTLKTILKFG